MFLVEDRFHQKADDAYLRGNIKENINTFEDQIASVCTITHCGDGYERGHAGTVVAEAGDAAVVGSGWKEAGDGHDVGGHSYGFLGIQKIKFISCHPHSLCL